MKIGQRPGRSERGGGGGSPPRKLVKTDQKGDAVVYLYDLASRLTERDYRRYLVTRAYDADNREATTYPNGKVVNRTCTARDQLGEVGYDSAMLSTIPGVALRI